MSRLPDAFIIGPPRTGTTSMYHYITSHPDVEERDSRVELRFFTKYYDKGLEWYKGFFGEDKFSIEGTTQYSYMAKVPPRIAEDIPDPKFIQLKRNRIDRAWSHFCMHRKNTNYVDGRSLEEYAFTKRGNFIIENSIYKPQIERYLEHFDKDQLLIVKSERFFKDTDRVYNQVLDFLGLSEWHKENYRVINDIRKPRIPDKTKSFLKEEYSGLENKLQRLIEKEDLNYIG